MRMEEVKEIRIFYCETEKRSQGVEILEYSKFNLEYAKKQFNKYTSCYMVKLHFEYDIEDEYEEILLKRNIIF